MMMARSNKRRSVNAYVIQNHGQYAKWKAKTKEQIMQGREV
jgi:hypothetical protein